MKQRKEHKIMDKQEDQNREAKEKQQKVFVISACRHSLSLKETLGVVCGDRDSASSSREMQRALTAAYVSGWRPFVCQVPHSGEKSFQGCCHSASFSELQGSTDPIFQGEKEEEKSIYTPCVLHFEAVLCSFIPSIFQTIAS